MVELSRRISATRNGRNRSTRARPARRGRACEQLAEAPLPTLAQRGQRSARSSSPRDLFGRYSSAVDVGDRQPLGSVGDLVDLVAGLHLALLEDAKVEPGAVVRDQQRGHRGLAHPDADAVAGHARLGDLEERLADAVAVADADLVVGEPVDGEVLAELAVDEVVASELALPVPVGLDLVDEHRAMFAAVREPVGLVVAVDVDAANHPRALDRLLPDRRPHGLALPLHLAGSSYVQRQQACGHDIT